MYPAILFAPVIVLATVLTLTLGPGVPPSDAQAVSATTINSTIEELQNAADAAPANIEAQLALAAADATAGRVQPAIAAYNQALTIDPNSPPALIGESIVLMAEGDVSDAGPLLDHVLAANPDQPDALIYRALARSILPISGSAWTPCGSSPWFSTILDARWPRPC